MTEQLMGEVRDNVVRHLLSGEWKIRKLTPRECFKLQGWSDEYTNKAMMINSDSQLYKQVGNGVTVDVVREIAKRLT